MKKKRKRKKYSEYRDGQDPSAAVVRKKLDPHHSRASSAQLEAITTQGYAHLLPPRGRTWRIALGQGQQVLI